MSSSQRLSFWVLFRKEAPAWLAHPVLFLFGTTPLILGVGLFIYLVIYPPVMWWVAGKMYQEETTCLFDYISPNVKAIRTSYFITKEGRVIVAKAKLFDEVEVGACGTGRKVVFRGPWVKFGTVSWFPRKYYEDTERFAPMIEPIMAERRQQNAWQSALLNNTEAVTEFLKNQYGLTRSDIYEAEALDEPKRGGVEFGVNWKRLQGRDFLSKVPGNVFRYTFNTRRGYINCTTWVDPRAVRTTECFEPTQERRPLKPVPQHHGDDY